MALYLDADEEHGIEDWEGNGDGDDDDNDDEEEEGDDNASTAAIIAGVGFPAKKNDAAASHIVAFTVACLVLTILLGRELIIAL